MGLFRRFGDILSANLNDLVDRFDDPEQMLRQAIREMEDAVASALNQAAKVIANEKLLAKQLTHNRQQAGQWHERARQALRDDDETLARRALARKVEHERIIPALSDQQTATRQAGLKLRRQIDGMRTRLAEAKRKMATLSARRRVAEARQKLFTVARLDIRQTGFSKFDQLCERVDLAEAEADALDQLSGFDENDDALADEIQFQVDSELAELMVEAKTLDE